MSISEWQQKWTNWVSYIGPHGDWARREILDTNVLSLLGNVCRRKILDAGCGEGRMARILSGQGADVLGIDIVPEFIEIASGIQTGRMVDEWTQRWPWLALKQKSQSEGRAIFQLEDMCKIPERYYGQFDAVVSCCSLNDVADIEGAIRSFAAILNNTGICVIAMPHPHIVRPASIIQHGLDSTGQVFNELMAQGFTVTNYYRTLSEIVNTFSKRGLLLDRMEEPLLS
ncbi:MAG: class I SAM-dependent methyltransferase, partial [Promethearchaeota archaeon]